MTTLKGGAEQKEKRERAGDGDGDGEGEGKRTGVEENAVEDVGEVEEDEEKHRTQLEGE